MPDMNLKVHVRQDDAYRAVFAEGVLAMATRVEAIIYSSDSSTGLVTDLGTLIRSAYGIAGGDSE